MFVLFYFVSILFTVDQSVHAFSNNRYAAMVVDGQTGKVLFAKNAHAKRHPASLTKKMTLYLLFEALTKGKIKLDSSFNVSQRATAQMPSKLGLKAGESIKVGDVIKALITKSANDMAVVAAEGLAGSVESFAALMNAKAKALGMTKTHFCNPSGVPDPKQVTTAHDMVVLGRALHRDFPQYYKFFRLKGFNYRGAHHRNHNHMLGAVDGLDGIKTGFINASGFNISTSTERHNRRVFAVVMGGQTRHQRDKHAKELIEVAFRKLLKESEAPYTKPNPNNMAALELEAELVNTSGEQATGEEDTSYGNSSAALTDQLAQNSEEDDVLDEMDEPKPAVTGQTPKTHITLIKKQTPVPQKKKGQKVLPANWVVPSETLKVIKKNKSRR